MTKEELLKWIDDRTVEIEADMATQESMSRRLQLSGAVTALKETRKIVEKLEN